MWSLTLIFLCKVLAGRINLPVNINCIEYYIFVLTGTSSLSKFQEDQKVFTITLSTISEEKWKHFAHESFQDAYYKMQKLKLKSILIPIKPEASWPTTKLVKALLYPLMNLTSQEVLTIILSSNDEEQCKSANKALQDANRKGEYFLCTKLYTCIRCNEIGMAYVVTYSFLHLSIFYSIIPSGFFSQTFSFH